MKKQNSMKEKKHKFKISALFIEHKQSIHAGVKPLPIRDYKVGFTLDREIRNVKEFNRVMDGIKRLFARQIKNSNL